MFRADARAACYDLPIVGDVRGDGYFFGIELVKDKATKETFDDDESERLLRGFLSKALFDAGLYCRADDRGDPVVQLAPAAHDRPGRVRRDRGHPARRADRGVDAALSAVRRDYRGAQLSGTTRPVRRRPRRRAPALRRRPRRRRRDRRRRPHRAVDGVRTCSSATRRCASWCSRRRSPGSAPRAATAAGAARCSRAPTAALERAHGREAAARDAAGDDRHRRRGRRASRPPTGIDCDFVRGRHDRLRPLAPCSGARRRPRSRRRAQYGVDAARVAGAAERVQRRRSARRGLRPRLRSRAPRASSCAGSRDAVESPRRA